MVSLIAVEGKEVVDLRGLLPVREGAKRYPTRPLEGITMAVIHYSGVGADSDALQIARYQTGKREGDLFPECAYSFVVRWDGAIEQCHDLETRTWHAGGRNNDQGIGLCLPGSGRPTPEQLDSTAALIQALARELGRSAIALYGGQGPGDRETGHWGTSPAPRGRRDTGTRGGGRAAGGGA